VNAEVILAIWAAAIVAAVALCHWAGAGERRRDAEEADRRAMRNALLNYRRHAFNGDEE
jgi:hypothetical protein